MRELKQVHYRILLALEKSPMGLKNYQLTSYLRLKRKQNTNYYLSLLLAKGLLQRYLETYRLSEAGKNLLPEAHVLADSANTSTLINVRIHDYGLRYTLVRSLYATQPPILLEGKPVALNHNTYGLIKTGRVTLKLTTKHLEIYTKDVYTDNRTPSIVAEAAIKEEFDRLALQQEAKSERIRLVRVGDGLLSEVVKQHFAEEHHALTGAVPEGKTILARHPVDGRQRLIVDMSKGFKELEAVHKLSAGEDKDSIDTQFNAVLDRKINLMDLTKLGSIEEREAKLIEIVRAMAEENIQLQYTLREVINSLKLR